MTRILAGGMKSDPEKNRKTDLANAEAWDRQAEIFESRNPARAARLRENAARVRAMHGVGGKPTAAPDVVASPPRPDPAATAPRAPVTPPAPSRSISQPPISVLSAAARANAEAEKPADDPGARELEAAELAEQILASYRATR